MKIKIILIILISPLFSYSQNIIEDIFQNKTEIYFSFKYSNIQELNKFSKIISIDHKIKKDTAYAYANKIEFKNFLNENKPYVIIEKDTQEIITDKNNWNYYPTYNEYMNMMQAYADSFPNICKIHNLGTLSGTHNYEIIILQISDNINQKENEPSFLYTSSMHGDELAGYVLSIRLIDYILNQYSSNPRITNIVNEVDIWINPLANPKGTFPNGPNTSVWAATRSNGFCDLNRNYPDPQDGQHPDGYSWQEETVIFMGLADTVNFTISANMHGGTELANYPWDTWSNLTADDNWWQYISREYADSCQANGSSGYFNSQQNGITNGHDWYEVDGGRQDYMNYFKHCRELTLELSNSKTPNPNDLPELWDANYPSLLNYIEQSLYGIRGIITDSISGIPLKAKVEIIGHDTDSSHVYSSLPIGNYHRYLYQGNYNITFSKNGYHSKTINRTILNNSTNIQDIKLIPIGGISNINEMTKNDRKNEKYDILGRNIKSNKNQKINKGAIIIQQ